MHFSHSVHMFADTAVNVTMSFSLWLRVFLFMVFVIRSISAFSASFKKEDRSLLFQTRYSSPVIALALFFGASLFGAKHFMHAVATFSLSVGFIMLIILGTITIVMAVLRLFLDKDSTYYWKWSAF